MNGLLFIRHAETDLAGAFCGQSDPHVNARGQQQIADLIQRLAHQPIDAVHSSDLQRAVTTGEALAQAFAAPLTTSAALREIYFGAWEGLRWSEIEERDAAYARRWTEAFPHLSAPGGEAFADFESRVRSQIDDLLMLAQSMRIAVVTHAGVMRLILRDYCGRTDQQAWHETASYCSSFSCSSSPLRHEVLA